MQDLQQSIFLNLSRVSPYHHNQSELSKPRPHFGRNRQQQIKNQFELVDFKGNGKLSKDEIKNYLYEKYQTINIQIVNSILQKMKCNERQQIQKYQILINRDQFCKRYFQIQKNVYNEINNFDSLEYRLKIMEDVYQNTKYYKPKAFAFIKITNLFIASQRADKEAEEWMDLQIQYEDHKNKINYVFKQPSHIADSPSFETLLPVQDDYFFVKYKFLTPSNKDHTPFGQCYVNIPIVKSKDQLRKNLKLTLDITKNNEKKGFCNFVINFQDNVMSIENQIKDLKEKQHRASAQLDHYEKQYQYMQYLWGIRHKHPHKINSLDVKWMIVVRILLILSLTIISILVQVLGRCEPLSFISALVLAKNWKYVILRGQKFLLTWMTIASLCLDIIWLAFCGDKISQINYIYSTWTIVLTYILMLSKILLLFYLIAFQHSLSSSSQQQQNQ